MVRIPKNSQFFLSFFFEHFVKKSMKVIGLHLTSQIDKHIMLYLIVNVVYQKDLSKKGSEEKERFFE